MANVAIVVGHSLRDTFCETLGKAYQRGAESGGHNARLFVLSRMNFDPILHEGYGQVQPLEPDLQAAREALGACDHLVIIFPLWCGTLPALLKGFIERVLQPDLVAMRRSGGTASWKIFAHKSARIVMTMGMPAFVYRWWFGAHALKMLKRNILHLIGVRPVRATLFGGIDAVSATRRQRWIASVEALGRQGA